MCTTNIIILGLRDRYNLLVKHSCFNNDARDAVRICRTKLDWSADFSCTNLHTDVRGRTPVLKIAAAVRSNMAWHTNGCSTVSNTRGEGADMASLVSARQAQLVVFAIHSNVFVMSLCQFRDCFINGLDTARLTHCLGGIVRVAACTIPVTRQRLGVERDFNSPLFCNADQKEASHPQVVAHGDALAWANLEFPLGRHDLCVDTAYVDSSV